MPNDASKLGFHFVFTPRNAHVHKLNKLSWRRRAEVIGLLLCVTSAARAQAAPSKAATPNPSATPTPVEPTAPPEDPDADAPWIDPAGAETTPDLSAQKSADSEALSHLSLEDLLAVDLGVFTSASRVESKSEAVPAAIAVVTSQDIAIWGVRTLAEALAYVPGMQISFGVSGDLKIGIRRYQTDESAGVKILIDGHSVVDPTTGGSAALFARYPLDGVERIEIIRGPGSAVYGANAFVGVINVITKKADGTRVSVRADTGLVDVIRAATMGSWTSGKSSLLLSGIYSNTRDDGRIITRDSNLGTVNETRALARDARRVGGAPAPSGIANTSSQYLDLRANYQWAENTQATVEYVRRSRGDFAGENFQLTYQPGQKDPSRILDERVWLEVKHAQPISDEVSITARAYGDFNSARRNLRWTIPDYTSDSDRDGDGVLDHSISGLRLKQSTETWTVGGEGWANFTLPLHNKLSVGVGYERNIQGFTRQEANFNPLLGTFFPDGQVRTVSDLTLPGYQRDILSGYLENLFQPVKPLGINVGLRVDRYSDFGTALSPRAAAVLALDSGLSLKGLWGTAFRAPSFQELFGRGNPYIVGNPELGAEKLNTFELQLAYQTETPWERKKDQLLRVELTGYYTQIHGAIRPDTGAVFAAPYQLKNIASLQYYGPELQVSVPIQKWWRVRGYYTIGMVDSGNGANTPEWNAMGSSEWSVPRIGGLSISTIAWGKRARTAGDVRSSLPAAFELSAAYISPTTKLFGLDWRARLGLKNLLDLTVVDPSPIYLGRQGERAFPDDLPRPGINAWLGLEGEWSK